MKLIARVGVWLVAGVAALAVALAASVVVDNLLGGGRLDAVTNVRLPNSGGPDIRAYLARISTETAARNATAPEQSGAGCFCRRQAISIAGNGAVVNGTPIFCQHSSYARALRYLSTPADA